MGIYVLQQYFILRCVYTFSNIVCNSPRSVETKPGRIYILGPTLYMVLAQTMTWWWFSCSASSSLLPDILWGTRLCCWLEAIRDWFDQPGCRTYRNFDGLVLKACKGENHNAELGFVLRVLQGWPVKGSARGPTVPFATEIPHLPQWKFGNATFNEGRGQSCAITVFRVKVL